MSKDVIHVHGEDVVVGEDTAKAFRGVNWAMISIGSFIAIIIILTLVFFIYSGNRGSIQDPRGTQEQPAAVR
ncbi:MAG: hypothetical protein ABJA02_09520 [Acidobacteriota bacterium]